MLDALLPAAVPSMHSSTSASKLSWRRDLALWLALAGRAQVSVYTHVQSLSCRSVEWLMRFCNQQRPACAAAPA